MGPGGEAPSLVNRPMAGMDNNLELPERRLRGAGARGNGDRKTMDSEVVEGHREGRSATPGPGKLRRPDVAGPAHRLAVPAPELDRGSAEKGSRTAPSPDPDRAQRESFMTPVMQRLRKVEQQYRAMRVGFVTVLIVLGFMAVNQFRTDEVNAGKTLIKSEELNLVDGSGRRRVSLRMFSEVPVMQVLDANGNPRLSFGLRFDDTPFIDLSDDSGMTRVRFRVTDGGEPALQMFDDRGESTFSIN